MNALSSRPLTDKSTILGVQPRTLEVIETLNLQYTLNDHGFQVCEAAFWGANTSGKLERTHVGPEVVHATPYPYILAVPQWETEKAFDLDLNSRGYTVDRPVQLLHFEYSHDTLYPIQAWVKNKFSNAILLVRCKYLVGCDGAGSTTRHILAIPGDSSGHDDVWAVADVWLGTDFPDIRRRSLIRSPHGAIMIIPNAGNGNRVYTQLTPKEVTELEAMNDPQSAWSGKGFVAAEWKHEALLRILQARLKMVLMPYHATIKRVFWISQYRIKQRIIEEFSDRKRVFVVGDACHTHSPKAAQGLNISMMDSYNLTWKLALVLQGKMRPELLETYNIERKQIAQELIEFDSKFSHLFGLKEFLDGNTEFYDVYKKAHGFTTGIGLHYGQNRLISSGVYSHINSASLNPIHPGKRFPPFTATRYMDGNRVAILSEMPSFGRFHVVIFAGCALRSGHFDSCASYLSSASSILHRYSPGTVYGWLPENIQNRFPINEKRVVDLFILHTDSHHTFERDALPAPLPEWVYRIYADEQGEVHKDCGVNQEMGAMVLVRPDGVVALITGLEGGTALTEFMDNFMVVPEEDR